MSARRKTNGRRAPGVSGRSGLAPPALGQAAPPPKRHRRRGRLGIGVGVGVVVLVISIVVVVALAGKPAPDTGGLPASALGPSACIAGQSAGGTGPWKLAEPQTLCGLHQATTPSAQAAAQELLNSTLEVFSPGSAYPDFGSETSDFAVSYDTPLRIPVLRYVNVEGFNGTFNPTVALRVLSSISQNPYLSGDVFHEVAPGPHGGAMECAPLSGFSEECMFATATTLGNFTFADSLKQLTGANTDANAIRIRDAVEVRTSS